MGWEPLAGKTDMVALLMSTYGSPLTVNLRKSLEQAICAVFQEVPHAKNV